MAAATIVLPYRRYSKFIGSTDKFDILISRNPKRFRAQFFEVAHSNTRFHNGNANFKFHNPILLKISPNFVLPVMLIKILVCLNQSLMLFM